MKQINEIELDDILKLKLNLVSPEKGTLLKVEMCKTVQAKQYEPEVFIAKTETYIPYSYNLCERAIVEELLHLSIEISIFTQMLLRKFITEDEFVIRKKEMTASIKSLLLKLEKLCPESSLLTYIKESN